MTPRKLLLIIIGALVLAACGGGDGIASAAQSVIELIKTEIASNTSDSAAPIVINDLPISEDGTDETSSPDPV